MGNIKILRVVTVPQTFSIILKGQLEYLLDEEFDVFLVCSSEIPKQYATPLIKSNRFSGIRFTRSINPFIDLISVYELCKIIKKIQPDIIHSQSLKANLVAGIAGVICHNKVRIQTMAGLVSTKDNSLKSKFIHLLEKFTFLLSTNVWPNSHSSKDYIIKKKMCNPSKLSVIGYGSTNGIDLKYFNNDVIDANELQRIKMELAIPAYDFVFLFVGRVVKDKGIIELINAFIRMQVTYKNVRLLIAGELEPSLDLIPNEILSEINLNEKIIFLGWKSDVRPYFKLASAFVFPSHREGFPNVLLQSGSLECPIICSSILGNTDIIESGVTGLLFKKNNVNDLYNKMEESLVRYSDMKSYAKKLKNEIYEKYDRSRVQRFIRDEYLAIMNKYNK